MRCSPSSPNAGSGGRLTRPDMQMRHVSTVPAFVQGAETPNAVGTHYLRRLTGIMRRVRELACKVGHPGLLHQMDCQKLWRQVTWDASRILHDAVFSFWLLPLPDAKFLHFLHEVLDTHRLDTERDNACERAQNFRSKLRRSYAAGGRAVFEVLRDSKPAPLHSIRDADGQVATDVNSILHTLSRAWGTLWNKEQKCEWPAFRDRYAAYLPSHACALPDITGERLQQCIKKMSSMRAVASCGTRAVEMKDLPLKLLDIAAAFYRDIEAGEEWPTVLTLGTVTCIRKGKDEDHDQFESVEVVTQEPLDTRPITNLSPWKTLYSSVRFQDMTPWRQQWMPDTMCGARQGKEVHDVSFQIALEMELHARQGKEFGLISMDRKKFFDLLEWDICEGILLALGAPVSVINAEKRFLSQLTNRFKVGAAFSKPSARSNSYVQGDSFSIQVALAIMSVWTRAIAEAGVSASSFLDDSTFRAGDCCGAGEGDNELEANEWLARLTKGLHVSFEFDRLSGCQLNLSKTKGLALKPLQRAKLRRALQQAGYDVEVHDHLVIVGGLLHTCKSDATKYFHPKVTKAADSCFLIGDLPLPVDAKLKLVGSTSSAQSCFGLELAHPTCGQVAKLSKAHMFAMFGARRRFRHVTSSLTLLGNGPRMDPVQHLVYYPLATLRRLLNRRPDLRELLAKTWHLKVQQGQCIGHKGVFPLDRLQCLVNKMQWTWDDDPFLFKMSNGCSFPWLAQEDDWWKHTLRNATRQMRWREEASRKHGKQSTWRESFNGAESGVNIHASTALLKSRGPRHAEFAPADAELAVHDEFEPFTKMKIKGAGRAVLRQLLTDSIFTWKRRWRMEQVPAPACPFCDSGDDESIMHIN